MQSARFKPVLVTHERHWQRSFIKNNFKKVYSDHGVLEIREGSVHFEGVKLQFDFGEVLEVKRMASVANRTKSDHSIYVAGPSLAALIIVWKLFQAFDNPQLATWISAFVAGPIMLFAAYHLLRVESWKTPWVEVRLVNANKLESKLYLMVTHPIKSIFNRGQTQTLAEALTQLISPAHAR